MAKRPSSAGSIKAESLTIRLRPKVKYGLELLSRKQHRSISDVVETLANKAFGDAFGRPIMFGSTFLQASVFDDLWAPTEAKRLVNLAILMPDLMTYTDELCWQLIKSEHSFWYWSLPREIGAGETVTSWDFERESPPVCIVMNEPENVQEGQSARFPILNMEHVEKLWPDIVRVAKDEISQEDFQIKVTQLRMSLNTATTSARCDDP